MVSKHLFVMLLLLGSIYSQDTVDEITETEDTSDEETESVDSTSDLDVAIEDAETELTDTALITSEDLYENAQALQSVLELMESTGTTTVTILGIDYDTESLSGYIESIELEAAEQEAIEEAVDIAENILDDGNMDDSTSEQLNDYAEALEDVLALMETDDVAVIFDIQYNYEEVEGLIEEAYEDSIDAEEQEALAQAELENAEEDLELEVLDGLEALENDELTEEETVELTDDIEELLLVLETEETIGEDEDELTTDDLASIEDDLEEQLNIDEEEAALVAEDEINEDGTTSEDLEEDLEAVEELIETLDDGSVVVINDEDYDESELEELAESIDEDIDDQESIEEAVEEAEAIVDGYVVLTSDQLYDYAEALEEVYALMDDDDYAVIFDVVYTKEEVDELIDQTLVEAEAAVELEALIAETEEVLEEELVEEINEALEDDNLTVEEEAELAENLEVLAEEIEPEDEVEIGGEELNADDLLAEAEAVEESAEENLEIEEAENVLSDDEDPTSEDLEDLIDELDDITVTETIEIDDEVIEDQDDLEEYIEELEILEEELEDQEILDEEIAEAEDVLNEGEVPTSADLFDLAEELEDVLEIMPDDYIVEVDGVEYDYESLEAYIDSLYTDAEILAEEEELEQAAEEAEEALGDASTSDQLLAYIQALEDLLEIMDEDDVVVIFDEEYTEADIDEEISETTISAEAMIIQEELDNAITEVELAVEDLTTSDEVEVLISEYEDLVEEMEDSDESTVVVSDDEVTVDDIDTVIEDLQDLADELASQEELNAIALEIEEYVDQYVADDGTVYITAEQLEGELELWVELEEALDEGETVIVDGWEYNDDSADDFIVAIEETLDYLQDEDVVQVVVDGEVSYMSETEYENLIEVEKVVTEIEAIMTLGDFTSNDLYALSDAVEALIELIEEEDVVVILGEEYTYDELVTLSEESENEAVILAYQESLDALADVVTYLIQSNNEYSTEEELEELLEAWEDLYEAMGDSDTVVVDYKEYTKTDVEGEIEAIEENLSELDDGEILFTDPETGATESQSAEVTESASLSSDAYIDLITSSTSFKEETPVVSTAEPFDFIASATGEPLIFVVVEPPVNTLTFLQTSDADAELQRDEDEEPTDDSEDIAGTEYSVGEVNFILVTTYIQDEDGTGKVYVLSEEDDSYTTLLIGLQEPTGLCFDVNHNFLYVADQGGLDDGKVYQYQINWDDDDTFELENTVVVEIYTGTPSDCKVDAYGNLYITDAETNSIHKFYYSDLYYGYSNVYTILYTADTNTDEIDIPLGIELLESDEIYFVNNGDGLVAGTLNRAECEIESTNEEEIQILVSGSNPAWGLALADRWVYYSLDTGDISAYHLDEKVTENFSTGFFIAPRGLCYGNEHVYVTDNGIGALYKMKEGEYDEPVLMFYVQAISSCFAVNLGDTDASMMIGVVMSIMWLLN
ncbi:hypothetical protein SteCoe_15752 [Stentor coeruleus]|uniref:VWFA domain-containing protein n=1 Tax=Stentor coeruleus TaxID=5963 RepID=A0A1R2C311_9CILI|nr:hypothetical protein SteCoe_15752 [Stentor coeruleus]